MTLAEHVETSSRWQRTLHAPETLDDDLGTIGMWLGPRKGPFKRAQGEKEDYALRRLLVAWKQAGALRFPVELSAPTDAPDFVVSWNDTHALGIVVVETGAEDYPAWLTNSQSAPTELHLLEDFLPTVEGDPVRDDIRNKIADLDRKALRLSEGSDLLIYDNSCWEGTSLRTFEEGIGEPHDLLARFRQVHIVLGGIVHLDVFGANTPADVSQAYEVDFVRWLFAQAEHLRRGAFDRLDIGYLAEELESLGRANKNALRNHMKNLMWHLLKWQFQPELRSKSWRLTVDNSRDEIHHLLTENPSLRNQFEKFLVAEYLRARRDASTATNLPRESFPEECPYTAEQLVNPEYLPD